MCVLLCLRTRSPLGRTAWAFLQDRLKALATECAKILRFADWQLPVYVCAFVHVCVCHPLCDKLVCAACGIANITSLLPTMLQLYYLARPLICHLLRCWVRRRGCGLYCKYNIWHSVKCTILVTNVCHTYAPKCSFDKSLSVFHFNQPATPQQPLGHPKAEESIECVNSACCLPLSPLSFQLKEYMYAMLLSSCNCCYHT